MYKRVSIPSTIARRKDDRYDDALDSEWPSLRSLIENMDVEKPSKDLDVNVTKDESYGEPWCMPGLHEKTDEQVHVKKLPIG